MSAGLCLRATAVLLLLSAAGSAQGTRRIVFAAGPKDHAGPGGHEYEKDLAALKSCLDNSNIPNIKTQLYTGKVPDAAELGDAAVLVMESSADRTPREQHVLFPQDATTDHQSYDAPTTARLSAIDALVKKGMGMVVFHYATYVNNAAGRKYFTDWFGSFYESGYSRTVVSNWNLAPTAAKHPILEGVEPWTSQEEFYILYRMPEDKRRTDLLTATPVAPTRMPPIPEAMVPLAGPPAPPPGNVEQSLVGWAIERPGGGRGFTMTGVHFHRNLLIDSYRKALLNGIVWAAQLEVPKGGVQCRIE